MSATPEARARTRAFARVIGPWLVIVPGIVVLRVPEMGVLVAGFFGNPVRVWFAGALLLFGGLLIIAFHQYWSSASAILTSLFGWFLALRGVVLFAAPQLIERAAVVSTGHAGPGADRLRRARPGRSLAHCRGLDRQASWQP